MRRNLRTLLILGASAVGSVQVAHADDAEPSTDLAAATDAVGAPADGVAAQDAGDETGAAFEAKLRWQSRSLTDYWYRDVDADGERTSSVELALEAEHPLCDDWRLWLQIDGWFDTQDTHWSSSPTDSIAFVAALRRDVGAGFELEFGARYDDWTDLNESKGDPWGPYAMLSYTFEAFGGEVYPYFYQELRNYIDGAPHDGTWITEAGAEFEAPLADAWSLQLALFGGRVDGSRTDPDVWAVGGSVGVAWAISESTSIGVSLEATRSSGAEVSNRTIGWVAVELTFSF